MSDRKVFFSWQGDTPNKCGRSFIRSALEEACKALSEDSGIEEAPRPISIDSDTQGVAGQPPIVETILRKIDSASVFVGDATFVAKRIDGRLVPNPNVLIEYGYALKGKTHERVILVMNTAFGSPTNGNLPFNLRHMRWPIQFALPETASSDGRQSVKSQLTKDLIRALKACFETVPIEVTEAKPGFLEAPTKNGQARFRAKNEPLGIRDRFIPRDQEQQIYLSEGPCAWLRVMPKGDQGKSFSIPDLRAAMASSSLMPLLRPPGGYSELRAEDGIGWYYADGRTSDGEAPTKATVPSVAFIFESGEIWSIDTSFFPIKDTYIPYSELEHAFVASLKSYSTFLQHIGITPPFRWIAGIHGVKNRRLAIPIRPSHGRISDGPLCVADLITSEGEFDGKDSALQALLPLFSGIFQKSGLDRPEWLPQN